MGRVVGGGGGKNWNEKGEQDDDKRNEQGDGQGGRAEVRGQGRISEERLAGGQVVGRGGGLKG